MKLLLVSITLIMIHQPASLQMHVGLVGHKAGTGGGAQCGTL